MTLRIIENFRHNPVKRMICTNMSKNQQWGTKALCPPSRSCRCGRARLDGCGRRVEHYLVFKRSCPPLTRFWQRSISTMCRVLGFVRLSATRSLWWTPHLSRPEQAANFFYTVEAKNQNQTKRMVGSMPATARVHAVEAWPRGKPKDKSQNSTGSHGSSKAASARSSPLKLRDQLL